MYKFKVEIEIDEEKVIREGEYNLEKIYEYINVSYGQYGFHRMKSEQPNQFFYIDNGKNSDFAMLLSNTVNLCKTKWFLRYAKRCTWINRVSQSTENVLDEVKRCILRYEKI